MNSTSGGGEDSASDNRRPLSVRLRDVVRNDLDTLYRFQRDPESNRMALTHPRTAESFFGHWDEVFGDPGVVARAIEVAGVLAGCISCFRSDDQESIGYWIGREFWGHGVATEALKQLLDEVTTRPLYARVATTNLASLRVLQKCGFQLVTCQHALGDERYLECELAILKLDSCRRSSTHRPP